MEKKITKTQFHHPKILRLGPKWIFCKIKIPSPQKMTISYFF